MSPFGFLFCFLRRCWANLSFALDPGCCTAGGGLGWARQWRSSISSHLLRRREVECVLNCTSNKLQSINRNIGVYQHIRSLSRRVAAIIHRLCIGHIRLTHSYLLSGTVRNVRLVIAHKESSTFWLNVLLWLALVTIILLQQHLSSFVYRSCAFQAVTFKSDMTTCAGSSSEARSSRKEQRWFFIHRSYAQHSFHPMLRTSTLQISRL